MSRLVLLLEFNHVIVVEGLTSRASFTTGPVLVSIRVYASRDLTIAITGGRAPFVFQ
jgi:hypothetical protein